jgi:hypothetical protein
MTKLALVMSCACQLPRFYDANGMATAGYSCPLPIFRAATTLLATGLLVSTLDFAVLLLVAGAAFLLRDFFSIAIVVSPGFRFELLYAWT